MKSSTLILFIFITSVIKLNAQDSKNDPHNISIGIPEVALLDLESTKDKSIELSGNIPTEAGKKVVFSTYNFDIWINYSSIIGTSSNVSRNVGVQITNGKVPEGLLLRIYAWNDARRGNGKMGKSSNYLMELKDSEISTIITGIGSAYTGNGPNKGHRIAYILTNSLEKDTYSKLDFDQSNTLTITYTLSDD